MVRAAEIAASSTTRTNPNDSSCSTSFPPLRVCSVLVASAFRPARCAESKAAWRLDPASFNSSIVAYPLTPTVWLEDEAGNKSAKPRTVRRVGASSRYTAWPLSSTLPGRIGSPALRLAGSPRSGTNPNRTRLGWALGGVVAHHRFAAAGDCHRARKNSLRNTRQASNAV
jgi:hypothetical protein